MLEVGCGPGLVATCLCRSGARRVLLTDGDPQTLVNCLTNLSMNGHQDGTLLGSWQEAAGFVRGQEEPRDSGHVQHQVCSSTRQWPAAVIAARPSGAGRTVDCLRAPGLAMLVDFKLTGLFLRAGVVLCVLGGCCAGAGVSLGLAIQA